MNQFPEPGVLVRISYQRLPARLLPPGSALTVWLKTSVSWVPKLRYCNRHIGHTVIAAKLMEIFEDVGIADGVVNYLPGVGEEIGPALVENPGVDLIAFTGSQAVGVGCSVTQGAAFGSDMP